MLQINEDVCPQYYLQAVGSSFFNISQLFDFEVSDEALINTPKRQGSLGKVGIMGFVFTNFQADNYGTSSCDDEGNCVYN